MQVSFDQKILKSFLLVVIMNTIFGVLLIIAIYITSQFTPTLMKNNYQSIEAVAGMNTAWRSLRHPKDSSIEDRGYWEKSFERALQKEDNSNTEPGEDEVVQSIHRLWEKSKKNIDSISSENFLKMKEYLDQLVEINQEAMIETAQKSKHFAEMVVTGGFFFLGVSSLIAVSISRKTARKLSLPIKKMVDVLQLKPQLGLDLNLPLSNVREVTVLSEEFRKLWSSLTQLKKLDVEALNIQKDQLTTILACVEDGVLVLDNSKKILHCNRGMLEILGREVNFSLGDAWDSSQFVNSNYVVINQSINGVSADAQKIELTIGGNEKIFNLQSRKIVSEKSIIGEVFLFRDVTEKSQEERLKREFISVLSHELKTPLQSLSTAIEILAESKTCLPQNRQFLIETINEDLTRIRGIAQDFFQVSLDKLHFLKLKFEFVALKDFVKDWLVTFQLVAMNKKIILNFETDGNEAGARIDKVKFPWILSNLISNAIRVSPEKSDIVINLTSREEKIYLRVSDRGPGVPNNLQKRIFEPYFQILEAGGQGQLGIGLTIAKELIDAHGGNIEYIPNIPTGAIFEIQLPVAAALA